MLKSHVTSYQEGAVEEELTWVVDLTDAAGRVLASFTTKEFEFGWAENHHIVLNVVLPQRLIAVGSNMDFKMSLSLFCERTCRLLALQHETRITNYSEIHWHPDFRPDLGTFRCWHMQYVTDNSFNVSFYLGVEEWNLPAPPIDVDAARERRAMLHE
jgi:hypothetical protein